MSVAGLHDPSITPREECCPRRASKIDRILLATTMRARVARMGQACKPAMSPLPHDIPYLIHIQTYLLQASVQLIDLFQQINHHRSRLHARSEISL